MQDELYMKQALEVARQAAVAGEVPVGAVLIHENTVITSAHNSPVSLRDPTAHAEILALRQAARQLGAYRIPGTTLYVTLEPCMMCFGAIVQARVERLVFAAADPKVGFSSEYQRLLTTAHLNHTVTIERGPFAEESAALLRAFFAARR